MRKIKAAIARQSDKRRKVGLFAGRFGMTHAPGHRTSHHLIEAEAYRRIMAGEAPETLAEFAQELLQWFRETYPSGSPTSLSAVEDLIQETWHRRHEMIRGG